MNNTERDEKPNKQYEAEQEHEPDRDKEAAEGSSGSADKPAGMPASDDPSPLGDTDQHSTA